jgi:DNA-binding transcriptional LysR family regulator
VSLDQRQLQAFLAIVDCGSLGRAADRVHLTQPALSRLVRTMEERLGVRLFERVSTGMALTDAGEAFLPHARHLVAELTHATHLMEEMRGLRRGAIRLGAVSSVTSSFLPAAIHMLQSFEPGLLVQIVEADTDALLARLLKREVDLAIAADATLSGVLRVATVDFHDHFTIVGRQNHPMSRGGQIAVGDLKRARWVLQAMPSTPRQLFDRRFADLGIDPPLPAVETGSTNAAVALLRTSDALGWMASRGARQAGLVALDVPDFRVDRQYFIYRRQNGLLPVPARRLLDFLPLMEGLGA